MLYISSLGENNCYDVKLVKFTKWQLSSLKMTPFYVQDNFEWHFVNLLIFTSQLFYSHLEINNVIQEPAEVN